MSTNGHTNDFKKEFEDCFKSFKAEMPEIKLRIDEIKNHSVRVSANSLLLSANVLHNDEEKLALEIAALFHDIGRAEMICQGTESPINIQRNHATQSTKIVAGLGFFQDLPLEIKNLILKTIENHNKVKLPKADNEQQTVFISILRDADKLDIFDSSLRFFKEKSGIQPLVTFDLVNSIEVSEKILKSIHAGKPALIEDMKTMNDFKLLLLSMVFDLNLKQTFRLVSERQYVQRIYETLPKKDQIIDAYRGIKLFVENKFVSSN